MNLLKACFAFLFLSAGLAAAETAPAHDLYLAVQLNGDSRVMGAKDPNLNGIYRRTADGFAHIGLNHPMLLSVDFDPRDENVFYAATLSGVLRTLDGGQNWRVTTDWDVTELKSVVVDPHAPDTVYAGVPDGFIVSRDRGNTWKRSETGLPARGKYTQVVAVDRTRAGRVFIGCDTGIYLSEDSAGTWRKVFAASATVDDLQQSPADPSGWISATQADGALISHDGGLSWEKLPGVPSDKALYNVAWDARDPRRLAIAGWAFGLLVSEDGGQTWTSRNAGLPEPARVWRTAIDPDDGRLYASLDQKALYVSDDFGRTWKEGGLPGSRILSFCFVPRKTQ
jgi:photosystem II stability/assembly factor-like uncharacterized protein